MQSSSSEALFATSGNLLQWVLLVISLRTCTRLCGAYTYPFVGMVFVWQYASSRGDQNLDPRGVPRGEAFQGNRSWTRQPRLYVRAGPMR